MTPNAWIFVSAVAALAVLVGLVVLRVLTNNRAEVRVTDAAIAVLPMVIALFAGGKIEELVIGKEGITVKAAKAAIVSAAGSSLGKSVTSLAKLDYRAFEMGPKGGSAQLEALKRANVGAFSLEVGCSRCYVAGAVRNYLETLTENPNFRYVALLDRKQDRGLFGVIEARSLRAWLDEGRALPDGKRRRWLAETGDLLQSPAGLKGIRTAQLRARLGEVLGLDDEMDLREEVNKWLAPWRVFVDAVESGDKDFLKSIPDFVPGDAAVSAETSKKETLERMATLGADWLPVVNEDGRLVGAVERAEVTASIILDLTENFERLAEAEPD